MNPAAVDIVAIGARTPIGLNAATSAAALRAGIMRVQEHPTLLDRDGEPVNGALDARLDPALDGPLRLCALLEPALREASLAVVAHGSLRTALPLFLALPEPRPGFAAEAAAEIRRRLTSAALPVELGPVTTSTEGHAAGLALLAEAVAQIRRGELELCLLAGVDSYFTPATMSWLDQHRQLAGPRSRSGFVPGEGAGACLLMSPRLSRRLRLPRQGEILATATATETLAIKTEGVSVGAGLTAAIESALAQLPVDTQIDDIVCDINGERYRSEEWGFVALRAWHGLPDPSAFRSPADTWGDMGAASGPLFLALTCQLARRGAVRGATTLIWTGSEGGLRAATVLRHAGARQD